MSWDPFLIKFLLEKKIFGSCEQYMGSTRKTEKPYKCASQKKKKNSKTQTLPLSSISKRVLWVCLDTTYYWKLKIL